MKPFDSKGEYTPEEVKAALAGIDGTRQLSFRYERLDRNNEFLEDIDYINQCTIENNALADIKRTAKMDVLDTGTINYLQDRIKPYIRLHMPEDATYDAATAEYSPDMWWKLDEDYCVPNLSVNRPVADAKNYETRETAFTAQTHDGSFYNTYLQAGSATLRNEAWAKAVITEPHALNFRFMSLSAADCTVTVYSAADDEAPLTEVYTSTLVSAYTSRSHVIPFPVKGNYYVQLTTADTVTKSGIQIKVTVQSRVQDSSQNNIVGTMEKLVMGHPGLTGTGTSAMVSSSIGQGQGFISVDNAEISHDGSLIWNMWMKIDYDPATTYNDWSIGVDYSTPDDSIWWGQFYMSGDGPGTPVQAEFVTSNYSFVGEIQGLTSDLFLGATAHMVSIVYYPNKDRVELWVDGKKAGDFIDPYSGASPSSSMYDFNESVLDGVSINATAQVAMYIDEIALFTRPMPDTLFSNLYTSGKAATGDPRTGYVEWPQGVFVLSSPTRTMQNGNTVSREVEGYDQLVILREDSFDYRYSVKKGTKYTDAVRSVLQSTRPVESIGLTDTMFVEEADVQILTDTSATFKPLTTYDGAAINTDYMVTFGGLYMSAKVTVDPGSQFSFQIDPDTSDVDGTFFVGTGFQFNTGVLKAIIDGTEYASATYNSTTHKYWRVREAGGFIFCDYSSNGNVWFNMAHAPLKHSLQTPTRIQIVGSSAGTAPTPVLMAIDEFKLTVPRSVSHAITSSPSKLPTGMEWEPGTPKLTIINDLLSAINYESATYNEDGIFVGRPYISPAQRTSSFTYATDSESVIMGDIDQTVDLFGVPNKWIIVVSEPDRPMLVGEYTNDDPHSPTSTVSRGRTIVDYRTEQSAPDQLTLDAQAARLAFSASQVYESIEFDTALMPIHQNSDVFDLIIDDLGIKNKYSEQSWSMQLKNGAAMSHKVRRVVNV